MGRVDHRVVPLAAGGVVAGAGVLTAVEAVATWVGAGFIWIPGGHWISTFETTPWSAPVVVSIAAAVAASGLLLSVRCLAPRHRRYLPLVTCSAVACFIEQRSTEAHLRRRLTADVPSEGLRIRLRPGADGWTLAVDARAPLPLKAELEQAARNELDRLGAPPQSQVLVNLTASPATSARTKRRVA
jgi:hypothetical protein